MQKPVTICIATACDDRLLPPERKHAPSFTHQIIVGAGPDDWICTGVSPTPITQSQSHSRVTSPQQLKARRTPRGASGGVSYSAFNGLSRPRRVGYKPSTIPHHTVLVPPTIDLPLQVPSTPNSITVRGSVGPAYAALAKTDVLAQIRPTKGGGWIIRLSEPLHWREYCHGFHASCRRRSSFSTFSDPFLTFFPLVFILH